MYCYFSALVALKDGNITVETNDEGTETVCTLDNSKWYTSYYTYISHPMGNMWFVACEYFGQNIE